MKRDVEEGEASRSMGMVCWLMVRSAGQGGKVATQKADCLRGPHEEHWTPKCGRSHPALLYSGQTSPAASGFNKAIPTPSLMENRD